MAPSLNRVTLIGNVVKDPEFRTTTDGRDVCNFIFATEECWKDKQTGDTRQKTEWHRITCFNISLIEMIKEREVEKGSLLWIEGQLQTRKWKDAVGADKASTEVVLHGFDAKLIILEEKPYKELIN